MWEKFKKWLKDHGVTEDLSAYTKDDLQDIVRAIVIN